MKENLNNKKSNSIFHFTKFNTTVEHILPFKTLKLGSYEKSRDPRERKEFMFGAINSPFNEEKKLQEFIDSNIKITKQLKAGAKVLCFCQDYFAENEWWDGYNLLRMWEQYADNHKGICLEIDIDLFKKENKKFIENGNTRFEEISYSNKDFPSYLNYNRINKNSIAQYLKEFRFSNYKFLFFQKNIDWKTEFELRLIHFGDKEKDYLCYITESLKRIIVGERLKEKYLKQIIKLANNTPIYRAKYVNGNIKAFKFKENYLKKL